MSEKRKGIYCIATTDIELCAWGEVLEWNLPRKPISAAIVEKDASRLFEDVDKSLALDRNLHWLIVEFLAHGHRPKKGTALPFWKISAIKVLDKNEFGVMKSRFPECDIPISLANSYASENCDKWKCAAQMEWNRCDIQNGITAFPRMFLESKDDIADSIDNQKIVSALLHYGEADSNDFIGQLVSYSRHGNFPCDGMVAALCDLGTILRRSQRDDEGQALVEKLSQKVHDIISDKKAMPSLKDTVEILLDFTNRPEYGIENILFLAWKYRLELAGGSIDLDAIKSDIKQMLENGVSKTSVLNALKLFGGLIGFKSFSQQYHRKMRVRT